jgi:hypothetical protein
MTIRRQVIRISRRTHPDHRARHDREETLFAILDEVTEWVRWPTRQPTELTDA